MTTDSPAPEGAPAEGAQKWKRIRRWAQSISALIAAVGIAAAGIGYITDGLQFFTRIADYFEDQSELRSLIAAADERLTRSDFEAAWLANAKARELSPRDAAAAEQQARVAMKWLENMRSGSADGRQTITQVIDPLKRALIERLADTEGRERADIRAHIGWANVLLFRAGRPQTDIAGEFDAALAEDPNNLYGHVMRGFWILSNGGPIDRARGDLDIALTSTVDPAYSDMLIMAGLTANTSDAFMVGAIEYAEKIHKAGRTIDAGSRRTVLWYYSIGLRDMDLLAKISAIVPADEQVAFLDRLRQAETAEREKRVAAYFMAFFAERAGKKDDALRLYRELVSTSPGPDEDLARLSQGPLRRLQ